MWWRCDTQLLSTLGRRHPFALSLVTATGKTIAADVVTQRYLEERDPSSAPLDLQRVGVFTAFGFWYLGAFQYWLYTLKFKAWFPAAEAFGEHASLAARYRDRAGLRDLLKQVAVGNFLHIPFVFLPCFYLTQEAVLCTAPRGSRDGPSDGFSSERALKRYRHNLWDDLLSAWAIWIPGHAIFFSVPLYLRLPTSAAARANAWASDRACGHARARTSTTHRAPCHSQLHLLCSNPFCEKRRSRNELCLRLRALADARA